MNSNPEGFEQLPVPVRPLDEEQARFLEILRAAGGRPVTFTELHSLGIDNPAVLCYELEIAGLPITRVERPHVGGTPVPVGVKLDEQWLNAPLAPERPRLQDRLLVWRERLATATRASGARARGLTIALAALARRLAAGALVLAAGARAAAEARLAAYERKEPRVRAARGSHEARAPSAAREARLLREARALRERHGAPIEWRPDARQMRDTRDALLGGAAVGLAALRRRTSAGLAALRTGAGAATAKVRAHDIPGIPPAPGRTRTAVLVGALALVAVAAMVIALGSSGSAKRAPSAKLTARGQHGHTARAHARGHSSRRLAQPESTPGSTGGDSSAQHQRPAGGEGASRATQLQAEGHQLLVEGRYAAAASDLRAAIAASGGSPSRCHAPSSESCLAYAYALYDLGRTLQLQHDPAAAVPVLNKRLRIDNQRETVRRQLRSARRQLHATPHPANPGHRQAGGSNQPAQTGGQTHGHAKHEAASGPEATGNQPQTQTQTQTQTQSGAGREAEGSGQRPAPPPGGAGGGQTGQSPPGGGTPG